MQVAARVAGAWCQQIGRGRLRLRRWATRGWIAARGRHAPIAYHTVVSSHMHAPQQPVPIANQQRALAKVGQLEGYRATVSSGGNGRCDGRWATHRRPKIQRRKEHNRRNLRLLVRGGRARGVWQPPILIVSFHGSPVLFSVLQGRPRFPSKTWNRESVGEGRGGGRGGGWTG